jgi:hypothetical protein
MAKAERANERSAVSALTGASECRCVVQDLIRDREAAWADDGPCRWVHQRGDGTDLYFDIAIWEQSQAVRNGTGAAQ